MEDSPRATSRCRSPVGVHTDLAVGLIHQGSIGVVRVFQQLHGEAILEHGTDFFRREVSDHHHCGELGAVVRLREVDHVLHGDVVQTLVGTDGHSAVGMVLWPELAVHIGKPCSA